MATPTDAHDQAAAFADFDATWDGGSAAPSTTPETPATPEPVAAPADTPAEPAKTEAPAAGPPPTQPTGDAAPKRRSDYEDWISKYGGDKDKAAAESWRITRENARLAQEREELRKQLEAREAEPAAPVEPEIPEEIRQIEDEMRAVQETSKNLLMEGGYYRQQANAYANGINQKNREIRTLSAQLARGGMELDQETVLRQKLSAAHQELTDYEQNKAAFDQEVRRCDLEAGRLVDGIKHLNRSKEQAERYLRLEQARAADDRRVYQAEVDRDASGHVQSVRTLATEIGIELGTPEKPSDEFTEFKETVFAPVIAKLRAMEDAGQYDGIPDEELSAEIRERALRYKASHDRTFQARSAKLAKTKEQQMATEGPTGTAAVVSPTRKQGARDTMADYAAFSQEFDSAG